MLPYYIGEYEPKQDDIDFEPAGEILTREDDKTFVKRRFDGIYNVTDCKSYTKNEDLPDNKEIFIFGFKHIKTGKNYNLVLFGCESDKKDDNHKLFNFWSDKFINKGIEMKNFEITRWPFMNLVKRNNFFKLQGVCY